MLFNLCRVEIAYSMVVDKHSLPVGDECAFYHAHRLWEPRDEEDKPCRRREGLQVENWVSLFLAELRR